jgi:GntR family transcriptional regulator, rspAB operon transcriptional repressor
LVSLRPTVPRSAPSKPPRSTAENGEQANLTDIAYRVIKQRLITLELPPGELFTEALLAAELRFSKTPVREALSRLRRDGLIEVMPRHGYRATGITLKNIKDICAVRVLLEVEAAGLAAQRASGSRELEALEEVCHVSYDPRDKESITRFLASNRTLHSTIARMSGNGHLERILSDILDQMDRVFHLGLMLSSRADEVVHEHTALVAAVAAGDVQGAREIAGAQIVSARDMVIEAAMSSPSLLATNLTAPPV